MVQNLERVLQRGEKIELLVQRTEELQTNAKDFRKVSTDLKNHYWWRNMKLWIIVGVCVLVRQKDTFIDFFDVFSIFGPSILSLFYFYRR